jgi:hypothetical protein
MFQTAIVQKVKAHILRSVFLIENRDLDEIMWTNIVQPDRLQKTIWSMRVSCSIPMATNTHPQYVIRIAFPLRQWLHKCASMLRYTYIAGLVCNLMIFRVHNHDFPQQEGKGLSF